MKQVLGDHIKQAGSLVEPARLRFDFTHFSPVTPEEIGKIERLVNERIRANQQVGTRILAREEALQEGATALFGEKYGETVRVVSVEGFSKELCGGTHVRATGDIGVFKIVSEGGIASGVRRIEALTGRAAFDYLQSISRREAELASLLNVPTEDITAKVKNLLTNQKNLEKQVAQLSTRLASSDLETLMKNAQEVAGVRVIAAQIPLDSAKTLREVGDKVRDGLDSGVAVLGGVVKDKVALLAIVTKDLTGRIRAGDIVARVAAVVGGKGGGRPDMAQAGGDRVDKLGEAIRSVAGHVSQILDS
jgi:alanyl-tRNA synthetase